MNILSRALLIICLIVITFQAAHPAWMQHAISDDIVFYNRAAYFFQHGSLANIPFNEYPPGPMIYFIFLSPVLMIQNSAQTYIMAFILMNVFLCFLYAELLYREWGNRSIILLALTVLFTGPILLYRFELFCNLLVFASIWSWRKNRPALSLCFLGWAILTKIYPAILLPYFGLLALQKYSLSRMVRIALVTTSAMTVTLVLYFILLRVSPTQSWISLTAQSDKPVSIESTIATALAYFKYVTTGQPAQLEERLIVGISHSELVGPRWVYNWLWLIPCSLFYIWLSRQTTLNRHLQPSVVITLISLFLLFSSQLAPQYFLWFILLLPLLVGDKSKKISPFLFWAVALALLLIGTSQVVFPLYYTELIDGYFRGGGSPTIFYLLVVRNLLLLIFTVLFVSQPKLFYERPQT